MNKRKLTKTSKAKYERIIDEWFVNGFNGAAAYRKFYPNVKKDATATVNFSRLQSLPEMEAYIHVKHEEASRIVEMTKEGILQELKNWIEADITETISLSPDEIKFVSKERAIDKSNKKIGYYEADNRQKAPQINYDGLSESTLLEIWNARRAD